LIWQSPISTAVRRQRPLAAQEHALRRDQALAAVTQAGLFDPNSRADLLDQIPEAGSEAFWGSYPPALIRAAKLELAMAAGMINRYLPALLVLSRDSDPRVRMDASETAGLGRATVNHPLLESILLGGLFDPSSKVVRRAIFGFTELPPQIDATRAAFAERLRELFARDDAMNTLTDAVLAERRRLAGAFLGFGENNGTAGDLDRRRPETSQR
jgi:hypothetical protein